jgi:hypothetical protein
MPYCPPWPRMAAGSDPTARATRRGHTLPPATRPGPAERTGQSTPAPAPSPLRERARLVKARSLRSLFGLDKPAQRPTLQARGRG